MLTYFLPAIVLLGIITSYGDLKEGKIRNKYIIFAIIYSVLTYIILISMYSLKGTIRGEYVFQLITNICFAIVIGYAFWNSGTWTAGDGKLFIAYAFLVPLTEYSNGYIAFFPSMVLLINAVVPFSIYMLIRLTFFTTIKQKRKIVKDIRLKQIGGLLIALFGLSWVSNLFFLFIGIPANFFMSLFVILTLMALTKKIFKKRDKYVLIIFALFRIFFDYDFILTLEFLRQFLVLALSFLILRFFFLGLSFEVFTKNVLIDDLKKGMVFAENIYYNKKVGIYIKEKIFSFNILSKSGIRKDDILFDFFPEGVEEKNIKKLIKLKNQKKLSFDSLKIQQTLPFAPFMFGGTIITLLIKGNFLIWIVSLIN